MSVSLSYPHDPSSNAPRRLAAETVWAVAAQLREAVARRDSDRSGAENLLKEIYTRSRQMALPLTCDFLVEKGDPGERIVAVAGADIGQLLDDDRAHLPRDLRIGAIDRAPSLGPMTDGTGEIDPAAVLQIGGQRHHMIVLGLGGLGGDIGAGGGRCGPAQRTEGEERYG